MIRTPDTLLGRLLIAKGSRVLDVGFGTYDELLALSTIVGDVGKVVGIERSRRIVQKTVRNLGTMKNVRVMVGDTGNFPAADSSIDVVLFKGVLHEVPDPHTALSEAKRVCDNNGKIMIVDFSPFPHSWLRRSNLRWRISHLWRFHGSSPDTHAGFSREETRSFFQGIGMIEDRFEDNIAQGRFYGHEVPMFLSVSTVHK